MREGFPKLSVAMDGDSQASQGRAVRSVFWKALPNPAYKGVKAV